MTTTDARKRLIESIARLDRRDQEPDMKTTRLDPDQIGALVDAIDRGAPADERAEQTATLHAMRDLLTEIRDALTGRVEVKVAEPVDVTEEPPVGSQVTDRDGVIWERMGRTWENWMQPEQAWSTNAGDSWAAIRNCGAPVRFTTDADRERVGLPVDPAPADVDPDEALRFIHPDAYDRERKWHGEQRVRAEKAEAAMREEVAEHDKTRATVLRLTRERDEARRDVVKWQDTAISRWEERDAVTSRYKALRAQVQRAWALATPDGHVSDVLRRILARDDQRGAK